VGRFAMAAARPVAVRHRELHRRRRHATLSASAPAAYHECLAVRRLSARRRHDVAADSRGGSHRTGQRRVCHLHDRERVSHRQHLTRGVGDVRGGLGAPAPDGGRHPPRGARSNAVVSGLELLGADGAWALGLAAAAASCTGHRQPGSGSGSPITAATRNWWCSRSAGAINVPPPSTP